VSIQNVKPDLNLLKYLCTLWLSGLKPRVFFVSPVLKSGLENEKSMTTSLKKFSER